MRAVMLWACVNLLCTSSYANAADPAAAKAVLNEAVRAHGGSSALAKLAGFIRTSSVELTRGSRKGIYGRTNVRPANQGAQCNQIGRQTIVDDGTQR